MSAWTKCCLCISYIGDGGGEGKDGRAYAHHKMASSMVKHSQSPLTSSTVISKMGPPSKIIPPTFLEGSCYKDAFLSKVRPPPKAKE